MYLGSFWVYYILGRGLYVSPLLSLRWYIYSLYKYSQKVLIKLCYYCSTKLEILEVSASWLFQAAMNILWERKYLVSDSFYSAATHRAGNLPDLTKIRIAAHPPLCSLLHKIFWCPVSLQCPDSLGERAPVRCSFVS